jgi:hypothetical protein
MEGDRDCGKKGGSMKIKRAPKGFCFLFLTMLFCFLPVETHCGELKSITVEMLSSSPSFSGSETICLVPIFKLSNPNDQMISVTVDYTLMQAGQLLGGSQMPPAFIPAGETIQQKDSIVVEYMSWFFRELLRGNSPEGAFKVVLPLWKGMNGKEPAKLPEGLWATIPASAFPITADGSVTVQTPDGSEKIFFFQGLRERSE